MPEGARAELSPPGPLRLGEETPPEEMAVQSWAGRSLAGEFICSTL